jgi:hypothetical protein
LNLPTNDAGAARGPHARADQRNIAQQARVAANESRDGMDPLQQAKSRPQFVEEAVRTALRDVVAWRIGGGRPPSQAAFIAAAVAAARLILDALEGDSGERSRTLAAVLRVARRFTMSALYRRLMQLRAEQFVRFTRDAHGADVIVLATAGGVCTRSC